MVKINKSLQERRKFWTPGQQTGQGLRKRKWSPNQTSTQKSSTKKKRNTVKTNASKKSKKKSKKRKR